MINQEIAQIFNEIADLLEIKGDNPFRIRAYRRAPLNIESIPEKIDDLPKEKLLKIPGIGADLAGKILEYINTGEVPALTDLKLTIPEGLLNIMRVPGIGPKTAKLLFEKFNISTIDAFRFKRAGIGARKPFVLKHHRHYRHRNPRLNIFMQHGLGKRKIKIEDCHSEAKPKESKCQSVI